MKLTIDIPEEKYKTIQEGMYCGMLDADLYRDIKNGIPHETVTEFADRCRECGREKVLDKIRAEIKSYEADCRLQGGTDECEMCNSNVFGSIYRIIDKYRNEVSE